MSRVEDEKFGDEGAKWSRDATSTVFNMSLVKDETFTYDSIDTNTKITVEHKTENSSYLDTGYFFMETLSDANHDRPGWVRNDFGILTYLFADKDHFINTGEFLPNLLYIIRPWSIFKKWFEANEHTFEERHQTRDKNQHNLTKGRLIKRVVVERLPKQFVKLRVLRITFDNEKKMYWVTEKGG